MTASASLSDIVTMTAKTMTVVSLRSTIISRRHSLILLYYIISLDSYPYVKQRSSRPEEPLLVISMLVGAKILLTTPTVQHIEVARVVVMSTNHHIDHNIDCDYYFSNVVAAAAAAVLTNTVQ